MVSWSAGYSIVFRAHALQRMFERHVSANDVLTVIESGQTIEERADDDPYPSRLLLGWAGGRPLHVVVSRDERSKTIFVVTVYEPDELRWDLDFRRRHR